MAIEDICFTTLHCILLRITSIMIISPRMTALHLLCIIDIFIVSCSTISATSCGGFEFLTPGFINNSLLVKEHSVVHITFSFKNLNCSNMSYGKIDISKRAPATNFFGRQCIIYDTCKNGAVYNNISCQCLSERGLFRLTFIATREDSTLWKWSATNAVSRDSVIEIVVTCGKLRTTEEVTYPSRVTSVGKIGGDRYIPRHKRISLFCSWKNGIPASEVRLLDRHGNVLTIGNTSGEISYTFQSIDCNNAGLIRCEANGSDKNMSLNMLVECPPEILIPEPKIRSMYAEQNTNITFPFRSHETHITMCHIILVNRVEHQETASFNGSVSFNCSKQIPHFTLERKYCIYDVTGIPPDLQLTLQVYNMKREDVGLWYVNVSNNNGSDGMYIQVDYINDGNDTLSSPSADINYYTVLHPPSIIGIVVGSITFILLFFLIIYNIKKGSDSYSKLRKRDMNAMPVYRGLGEQLQFNSSLDRSQGESEIYYEIANPPEHQDLHSSAEKFPVQLRGPRLADSPQFLNGQIASKDTSNTADIQFVKSTMITSPALVRSSQLQTITSPEILLYSQLQTITSPEILRYSQLQITTSPQILKYSKVQSNIDQNSQSNANDHLQTIQAENEASNEPVMTNDLK